MVQDLDKGTVWVGQPSYTEALLKQFRMKDAKAVKTPVNSGLKLTKASDDAKAVDEDLLLESSCIYRQELVQILLLPWPVWRDTL